MSLLMTTCLVMGEENERWGRGEENERWGRGGGGGGVNQSGIPAGVNCVEVEWCDTPRGTLLCSTVCQAGSVEIAAWHSGAISLQTQLARRQDLCHAVLQGSHNSAITLANGYGNGDALYSRLLRQVLPPYAPRWMAWRTNNQWLALTDQLRLGVRSLELDVHWAGGELRIAHCGGVDLEKVDGLLGELNGLLEKEGLPPVDWDTETLGCDPSFSAIPARLQRSFASALQEVAAWMVLPANAAEFVLLMLDCQEDLLAWDKVPLLEQQLQQYLGAAVGLVTPALIEGLGVWPPLELLVAKGARALVAVDCPIASNASNATFFLRSDVCGWTEPDPSGWAFFPECAHGQLLANAGRLIRIETDAIQYGPLNSGGGFGPSYDLNASLVADFTGCNVNMPAPDYYTPEYSLASIWTWAPDQPSSASSNASCVLLDATLSGRWISLPTCDLLPLACAIYSPSSSAPPSSVARSSTLGSSAPPPSWIISNSSSCPSGSHFDLPTSAYDNNVLLSTLLSSGVSQVRINYQAYFGSVF